VKPPQQARSQKTLENMLDAAEAMIAEGGVASVTVSEVVRRAGSSVGAFYARFPDKDALLSTLHQRSCGEALATAELALDPARWVSTDFARAVFEVVRFTALQCRERRGLMLAFIAMAANDRAYAERRAQLDDGLAALLHAFLSERRDEFTHPDVRLASTVAIRLIMGSLELGGLSRQPDDPENSLPDERLAEELSRAVLAYLGAPISVGRLRRS
jgi:AcrR family transcriptional regulator